MDTVFKKLVILGSTGSVGSQALQVAEKFPERFEILGLSANTSASEIISQIKKFKPKKVAMMDASAATLVKKELRSMGEEYHKVDVLAGIEGLSELAALPEADIVLTAVVGSIGIIPTLAAIKAGKTIALANKETLVAAGEIVMKHSPTILPVDSEHSALFQCLIGEDKENIANLILTCSGGPFRKTPLADLKNVSRDQALNHPSWKMGGKITIDSSTLMNKGFEVIEAHWLFDIPYEHIKVAVHPQSIVHSLVEFKDGSVKAQLGEPSMLVPIQLAFSYPERWKNSDIPHLPISRMNEMTFEEPDLAKFPCLDYAYQAGKEGGTMPAVINAANEVAVEYFLKGKIKYLQIAEAIKQMMDNHTNITDPTIDDILAADEEVKAKTREVLNLKFKI